MRGKTLEDVARAADLQPSTISKYETGMVHNIPQIKVVSIAQYLNVSPYYLLGMEDPEDGPFTLSISEQVLVEQYRRLSPADRKTLMLLAERLDQAQEERGSYEQLTL